MMENEDRSRSVLALFWDAIIWFFYAFFRNAQVSYWTSLTRFHVSRISSSLTYGNLLCVVRRISYTLNFFWTLVQSSSKKFNQRIWYWLFSCRWDPLSIIRMFFWTTSNPFEPQFEVVLQLKIFGRKVLVIS